MEVRNEFARSIRNGHYEETDNGLLLPKHGVHIGGEFTHEVIRNGVSLGKMTDKNMVVNEGLNHILDVVFHGDSQVTTWYIGIFKGAYTPVATTTGATVAGAGVADEFTAYDETTREAWVEGAAASQSMTNSTAAQFTISTGGNATIKGAFLISNSTKGGSTGTLMAISTFGTARDVVATDVLNVTYTLNIADA